jgi:chorismate mutase
MNSLLSLHSIRHALARLEETIIFGLIERAQFRQNRIVYKPDGVGPELGGESLMGFILHESEKSHAKVRRYTSPDEHPFFSGLPAPILPPLRFVNPLRSNTININSRIRDLYEKKIVPLICQPGDDMQWGSSALNDVILLQALSKRIHYGKFVAEAKFRVNRKTLLPLIQGGDRAGLLAAVTDRKVEAQVCARVEAKATAFGREFDAGRGRYKIQPCVVRSVYSKWIIPLNKEVQVLYLLGRNSARRGTSSR